VAIGVELSNFPAAHAHFPAASALLVVSQVTQVASVAAVQVRQVAWQAVQALTAIVASKNPALQAHDVEAKATLEATSVAV